MPPPLVCTSNRLFSIDYGIPIVANKSTDYRTTTNTYHRHISGVNDEFDVRVKAKIKPALKIKDVALRDELYKTITGEEYKFQTNSTSKMEFCHKPALGVKTEYTRNVEEKIFNDPPPPRSVKLSEMKDSFRMKFQLNMENQDTLPPFEVVRCEISGLGRDEQPPVRPEEAGYWKHLDPYMTTNRSSYIPYDLGKVKWASEDSITLWNSTGKYKGLTIDVPEAPKSKMVFDKMMFKEMKPNKLLPNAMKRIPHAGMQSEYKDSYVPRTFSDFYPYVSDNNHVLGISLSKGGPWQNLCPPAMYCTEYCHIGTGWPIRATIDPAAPKKFTIHQPCIKTTVE